MIGWTPASERPSWDDILAAEPRLAALEVDLRAVRCDERCRGGCCAIDHWGTYVYHPPFKDRMLRLVGMGRRPVVETVKGLDSPDEATGSRTTEEIINAVILEALLFEIAPPDQRFLYTSAAYDAAYDHLMNLLPLCETCSCHVGGDPLG